MRTSGVSPLSHQGVPRGDRVGSKTLADRLVTPMNPQSNAEQAVFVWGVAVGTIFRVLLHCLIALSKNFQKF